MRGASERVQARRSRSGLALLLSLALAGVSGPARAQEPIAPTNFPQQAGPPAWTPPARPVLVDLRFSPHRALRDGVLRIAPQQANLPATSERPIYGPTMTLSLPPGVYMLNVSARRHEANLSLEVRPGMYPVEVTLQRRKTSRGDAPRFINNDPLVASIGGVGLISLLAGAGLVIVGAVREGKANRRNEDLLMDALVDAAAPTPKDPTGLALVEDSYATETYHRDLSRAMTLSVAGGAVAMSGLAGALTSVVAGNRLRHRAAYVQMGFGAALLAGGAVALAFFERDRKAMLTIDDPALRFTRSDRRTLDATAVTGSLLTGLGVGLLLYPAVALIGDKMKRRRTGATAFAPYMGPGQAGFSLRGEF